MSLTVDSVWITHVLLVSMRIGALFAMTPLFGAAPLPGRVRAFLALALATAMVGAADLPARVTAALTGTGPMVLACLSELAIGAAMAFGLFAAFAAFQFAGKLLDIQIGFSLGTVFDPVTRTQAPLLGTMLNLLAVMLFFSLDAHHLLLRAVAHSLESLPPGSLPTSWDVAAFADQFGVMFVFGLTIAAPVVFALLLLDVGLGIASRTMPQLNIFTVGIPIKIAAGLLAFTGMLAALAPVVGRVFNSVFNFWQRLGI
jgi:flagellar biosynthesis protein FliR